MLSVSEFDQGQDLNQDGDTFDNVVHVHNLVLGETTNLGLAGFANSSDISGDQLVFRVNEQKQRMDLNDDGDADDRVLHVHDLESGETTNLAFAGSFVDSSPDVLFFSICERRQGEDLNGDGDRVDSVLHVLDPETEQMTNLGLTTLPLTVLDDLLVVSVPERDWRMDLNGDGDRVDSVLHLVDLSRLSKLPRFVRGDCDSDGVVEGSLADPLFYLEWAFSDGPEPECLTACDADGDGFVGGSVTDPLYYLNWAFVGSSAPPLPFPRCGASLRAADFPMRCDAPAECP